MLYDNDVGVTQSYLQHLPLPSASCLTLCMYVKAQLQHFYTVIFREYWQCYHYYYLDVTLSDNLLPLKTAKLYHENNCFKPCKTKTNKKWRLFDVRSCQEMDLWIWHQFCILCLVCGNKLCSRDLPNVCRFTWLSQGLGPYVSAFCGPDLEFEQSLQHFW